MLLSWRLGRGDDEAITLQGAIDRRKLGGLIATRRLQQRIARYRSGDVEALAVKAGEPVRRGLGERGSKRAAEAEGGDLDGGYRRAKHALLPALGDAGLPRQQRGDVLVAGVGGHQREDAEAEAEGRKPCALR